MHIYHYAPYEPTAIKRLVGRHGTCVDEVDELLRAGVFVDLYRAVRQGIRASVESYSIKRLEPLYGFTRMVPLQDANFALQSYEAAMALGNDLGEIGDLLKTIEGYNRDDCVSALRLRDWLEERRKELADKCGRL
jgi:predicted RecB family nuclease